MSLFTWNSYPPPGCFLNLLQGVCGIQMELPIYQYRLCVWTFSILSTFTLPWKNVAYTPAPITSCTDIIRMCPKYPLLCWLPSPTTTREGCLRQKLKKENMSDVKLSKNATGTVSGLSDMWMMQLHVMIFFFRKSNKRCFEEDLKYVLICHLYFRLLS